MCFFCKAEQRYETMEKDARQSTLEAQAAKDEVVKLHETVARMELELQVCSLAVCLWLRSVSFFPSQWRK